MYNNRNFHKTDLKIISKLEIKICKESDPIIVNLDSDFHPHILNSILITLFDKPSNSIFTLFSDDEKHISVNLTESELHSTFKNGSYSISHCDSQFNFDDIYNKLNEKNEIIKYNGEKILFNKSIISEHYSNFTPYNNSLFYQNLIIRSFIDIIKDNNISNFNKSILNTLSFPKSKCPFSTSIIVYSLIEVISILFGDECLWDINILPETLPSFQTFIGILVNFSSNYSIINNCLEKILEPFCPTLFF